MKVYESGAYAYPFGTLRYMLSWGCDPLSGSTILYLRFLNKKK